MMDACHSTFVQATLVQTVVITRSSVGSGVQQLCPAVGEAGSQEAAHVRGQGTWGLFVPSSQGCCEPHTALKMKSLKTTAPSACHK